MLNAAERAGLVTGSGRLTDLGARIVAAHLGPQEGTALYRFMQTGTIVGATYGEVRELARQTDRAHVLPPAYLRHYVRFVGYRRPRDAWRDLVWTVDHERALWAWFASLAEGVTVTALAGRCVECGAWDFNGCPNLCSTSYAARVRDGRPVGGAAEYPDENGNWQVDPR